MTFSQVNNKEFEELQRKVLQQEAYIAELTKILAMTNQHVKTIMNWLQQEQYSKKTSIKNPLN
ncbi:hypothetical protein RZN22_05620 [Bacillaceae bacterium S4-13-58]